jgi:DNA-binding NarL/FixJ family response regulator
MLVDDHAAFRLPLALVLERERDIIVAAEAGSLAEARAALPALTGMIDVALVDLLLPDGNGVELVAELRARNPDGQVIVLTADPNKTHHARAIEEGAVAVIGKTLAPDAIANSIRRVHAGEAIQPVQEIVDLLRYAVAERERTQHANAALAQLTDRERAVLIALADGLDNKAIAERLFISPETARTHVAKIIAKLGVESRLQAGIFAVRHGVVSAPYEISEENSAASMA